MPDTPADPTELVREPRSSGIAAFFTARERVAEEFSGAPPVDLARLRADLDTHASPSLVARSSHRA